MSLKFEVKIKKGFLNYFIIEGKTDTVKEAKEKTRNLRKSVVAIDPKIKVESGKISNWENDNDE